MQKTSDQNISESSKIRLSLVITIISLLGAIGSGVLSYSVTTATVQSEIANIKSEVVYDRDQNTELRRTVTEVAKDVAEMSGKIDILIEHMPRKR